MKTHIKLGKTSRSRLLDKACLLAILDTADIPPKQVFFPAASSFPTDFLLLPSSRQVARPRTFITPKTNHNEPGSKMRKTRDHRSPETLRIKKSASIFS